MSFYITTAGQTQDGTVMPRHDDDLSAARGVFAGILMGAGLWLVLIVGIGFAQAGPPTPVQKQAARTFDASKQARSLAVPGGVRDSNSKEA